MYSPRMGRDTGWRNTIVIPLPASGWDPRVTSPSDGPQLFHELGANLINRVAHLFVHTGVTYMQREVALPPEYDGGTIRWRARWYAIDLDDPADAAVFGLQGRAFDDADNYDQALGSAVEATDAVGAVENQRFTAWSTAVTLSGTPAAGKTALLQFYRQTTGNTLLYPAYVTHIDVEIGVIP